MKRNVIQFQGILGNLADSCKHIVWCCVLFIERCFLNVQIKNEIKNKIWNRRKNCNIWTNPCKMLKLLLIMKKSMREQYCKQVSFKSITILNFDGHITWCLWLKGLTFLCYKGARAYYNVLSLRVTIMLDHWIIIGIIIN